MYFVDNVPQGGKSKLVLRLIPSQPHLSLLFKCQSIVNDMRGQMRLLSKIGALVVEELSDEVQELTQCLGLATSQKVHFFYPTTGQEGRFPIHWVRKGKSKRIATNNP